MWKKGYGQFCPVARAAELVTLRWMPLVLRELMAGACRFAELRRGIPLITQAVLAQRLRELVDAGVVERASPADGHPEYRLTPAGEELRPVIQALGAWGQRWTAQELREDQLDPELVMWVFRRRLALEALPRARAVLEFEFPDVPIAVRRFWLVVDHGDVDLCLRSPGHAVDLSVVTSLRTLVALYLGQVDPAAALRAGAISLDGSPDLRRSFPAWCARSAFAGVARAPPPGVGAPVSPLPLAGEGRRTSRTDRGERDVVRARTRGPRPGSP